jgi:NTP pyrophosphatase (non-canonical NTP hydrolase)
MKTFKEYQAFATTLPVSLRNNRDRIELPVLGLQEEAGKIGSLLAIAFASGKFGLTPEQSREVNDRLSDILWYLARLCGEAGIDMQDVATHSIARLQARTKQFDPDRR